MDRHSIQSSNLDQQRHQCADSTTACREFGTFRWVYNLCSTWKPSISHHYHIGPTWRRSDHKNALLLWHRRQRGCRNQQQEISARGQSFRGCPCQSCSGAVHERQCDSGSGWPWGYRWWHRRLYVSMGKLACEMSAASVEGVLTSAGSLRMEDRTISFVKKHKA